MLYVLLSLQQAGSCVPWNGAFTCILCSFGTSHLHWSATKPHCLCCFIGSFWDWPWFVGSALCFPEWLQGSAVPAYNKHFCMVMLILKMLVSLLLPKIGTVLGESCDAWIFHFLWDWLGMGWGWRSDSLVAESCVNQHYSAIPLLFCWQLFVACWCWVRDLVCTFLVLK